jgi:hypothetical protein
MVEDRHNIGDSEPTLTSVIKKSLSKIFSERPHDQGAIWPNWFEIEVIVLKKGIT